MDEIKIDIFLSQGDLENILFNDDKYPNLFHIIKDYSRLYINMESDELEMFLEDMNELVNNVLNDIPIFANKDMFDSIHIDDSIVVSKPTAIFFLDVSPEDAFSISEKYGIIIQSSKNIKDDIFQLSFYKYFEKGIEYNGKFDGWKNSLVELSLPPFNSLVITDDYLLTYTYKEINVGFENLKMMLNAILPEKLCTTFHLLIITPMDKISTKKANKLNGDLKAYLKTIRPYEFNLEFIFRNTIHPRKAFANYFIITCDKGFKLFHPKDKISGFEEENDLRINSILHDAANIKGDCMLMASRRELKRIKNLCDELSEQIRNNVPDHTKKIIGDTNSDKSVRNRLLNC